VWKIQEHPACFSRFPATQWHFVAYIGEFFPKKFPAATTHRDLPSLAQRILATTFGCDEDTPGV